MTPALRFILRKLLSVALVIAMGLSGFAHAQVRAPLSPDLARYIEEGGSLADLCGGAGTGARIDGPECDACRLLAGALLPPAVPGIVLSAPFDSAGYILPRAISLPMLRPEHKRRSRAPPLT